MRIRMRIDDGHGMRPLELFSLNFLHKDGCQSIGGPQPP